MSFLKELTKNLRTPEQYKSHYAYNTIKQYHIIIINTWLSNQFFQSKMLIYKCITKVYSRVNCTNFTKKLLNLFMQVSSDKK